MTVLDADLVAAIETTLHFYPPVPGLTDPLAIPGVQGRVSALSHPLANLVGMARLDEKSADATIDRVTKRFADQRKAFGWITGPGTTPRDLARRLEKHGLRHAGSLAGMALTDLDREIMPNPSVEIREVTAAETARETEMMGRAYGMPAEVAGLFTRLLAAPNTGIRGRGYFAYLDGDTPVAWSYLIYVPRSPIVLLGGAATLPEHRGHGTYTALVKRRLDDARGDGREAAIVQADRDTSAPICVKLGFRELCSLGFYAWAPPES